VRGLGESARRCKKGETGEADLVAMSARDRTRGWSSQGQMIVETWVCRHLKMLQPNPEGNERGTKGGFSLTW
jgi:hypothetical protein